MEFLFFCILLLTGKTSKKDTYIEICFVTLLKCLTCLQFIYKKVIILTTGLFENQRDNSESQHILNH